MMLDLAAPDAPDLLETEVAIIGAGAAGITLARSLADSGQRVCLLEAGGLDFDEQVQDACAGPNLGMPYYDLVDARLRFFGGTTNIWGGRCTPLEPIDFEKRDWVAHSGWPITAADLSPYYHQAHEAMDLGPYDYEQDLWAQGNRAAPELDGARLHTRFWHFDTQTEPYGARRSKDVFDHPRIQVVLHANVTHLQAAANAASLEHIKAQSLTGHTLKVKARHFVLAGGGMENPRLLLASNDVETDGIGNGFDQVGRYFMEHQHGRVGQVKCRDPWRVWHAFHRFHLQDGRVVAPVLLASAQEQAKRGMLNSGLTFKLQRKPERGLLLNDRIYRDLKHKLPPDQSRRRLWHTYRGVRSWAQTAIKPALSRLRARLGLRQLYVMVRAEQAPNPESRVVLSEDRDRFGVPRAGLDWQLSSQDKHTVAELCALCDSEFKRSGTGHMVGEAWLDDPSPAWPVDDTVSKHPIAGYHHMGTTRMSADARHGVVDGNCRVHGYANLFVAGSSVFATGGWANPTLTIVALALRLADHLKLQNNKENPHA